MLRSLELENFKAFGERVKIPCAPITLIFGQNSSGKSSILQSLHLLKQTAAKQVSGAVLLPRVDNGIVDLGRFQDLLYDHDTDRSLNIRINLNTQERAIQGVALEDMNCPNYYNSKSFGFEYSFSKKSPESDIRIDHLKLFLGRDKNPIISYDIFPITKSFINGIEQYLDPIEHPSPDLAVAMCSSISEDHGLWIKSYEYYKTNAHTIANSLVQLNERIDLELYDSRFYNIDQEEKAKIVKKQDAFNDAIQFYSSDFSIDSFVVRMKKQIENNIIGMDGFIPVKENPSLSFYPDFDAVNFLNEFSGDFKIPKFGLILVSLGRCIEEFLKRLFPLGPFRRPPERWYAYIGASPNDVGYNGNTLPDLLFRRPGIVNNTNDWLKKLNIGYRISVKTLGNKDRDLFEVRLVDTRRKHKVEVCLSDVGFGISQILPLIVQSLSSTNRTITIEQPEVHIHPGLQADLGDLLAEAIKEPRKNQFIIETHSEHLILRLQRLVREGTLSPQDISVIYARRGADGSLIDQLMLDEDGNFIDDWPEGFFPERLNELR